MNKRNNLIIISLLILLLIVPSVYAFSFSEFFKKIFGISMTGGSTNTNNTFDGTYLPCTDSDGGENVDVAGVTTGVFVYHPTMHFIYGTPDHKLYEYQAFSGAGETVFYDYCTGAGRLGEAFCNFDGKLNMTELTCPYGCKDGVCIGTQPCYDSDGGKDYYTKGTVTHISSSYTDGCFPSIGSPTGVYLHEYHCRTLDGVITVVYTSFSCPSGTTCLNGACVLVSSSSSTNTTTSSTSTSTTSSTSITCSDSDGGKDYIKYGITTLSNGTSLADSCSSETSLFETSCSVFGNQISITSYTCQGSNGTRCIDGACINPNATTTTTTTSSPTTTSPSSSSSSGGGGSSSSGNGGGGTSSTSSATPAVPATSATPATSASSTIPAIPAIFSTKQENITELVCKDSDEGINVNLLGKTCQNDNCVADICISKDYLIESYCVGNLASIYLQNCDFGCKSGVCLQEDTVVFNPDRDSGPIKVPEELIDEEISEIEFVCNGCFQDKKCYPFGYRKSKQYCSEDFAFVDQLEQEESCENNFQCTSNVCAAEECVSSSLIKKLFEFFRSMFS